MKSLPSVNDIVVIETAGSWQSKSGGELNVLFALPQVALKKFLDFENPAFDKLPEDIKGLRSYVVKNVPKGGIGGKEWHEARTELITVLVGSAVVTCIDLKGGEKEFVLDGRSSVILPPRILHTYQASEEGTTLVVVANTLFDPENPKTHDTFTVDTFE